MMYGETVDLLSRRTGGGSAFGGLLRFARNQVAADVDQREVLRGADLQVAVGVRFKGRSTRVEQRALAEIAQRVVTDGTEDYIIILGNGMQITPDKVVHSKPVSVPVVNQRMDHNALWEKMHEYLYELESSRALYD
jgi:hypothetical protein